MYQPIKRSAGSARRGGQEAGHELSEKVDREIAEVPAVRVRRRISNTAKIKAGKHDNRAASDGHVLTGRVAGDEQGDALSHQLSGQEARQ